MEPSGPRLEILSRRVETLLWLVIPVMAWEALTSPGPGRLVFAPGAVGLALMLGLHRARGGPARTLLQWAAGVVGVAFTLAALGILAAGILLITRGSFGILAGLVAIPLSIGLGAWGWGLLVSALSDPERKRRLEIDLDQARASEAVRRFDALHRPPGALPGPAPAGEGEAEPPV